ncbi:hypothetical protein [Actinoplanes sp. HUAS TT8]|uniref:hypothetical protein n=1 Tax=Actinoplanes sp. HUAS TT8 TaxID=3447453 RepID=UPI003F51CC7A
MSVHIGEVHSDVSAQPPAAPAETPGPQRTAAQLAEQLRDDLRRERDLTARLAAEAFDD